MAEIVLLELIRRGNSALPIHDSFMVPTRQEGAAREQMGEAFDIVISRARGVSRMTKLDQQLKPKSTYTMVITSPLPSLSPVRPFVVSLPGSSLSDLSA